MEIILLQFKSSESLIGDEFLHTTLKTRTIMESETPGEHVLETLENYLSLFINESMNE